jgi:branched-chain amino acid transport system permease protein
MAQSTITSVRPPVLHQRTVATVRRYFTIGSGAAIVLLVVWWLGAAFVKQPALFTSSVIIGFQNGALYALVALGYTLVYGIIELINFAHGDLFMLGTLFAGFMITTVFGVATPATSALGWVWFVLALVACMAFCATINVTIEFVAYRRLRRAPKLAPLITAVGMSFVLQFFGLLWNGSRQRANWASVLPQGHWTFGSVRVDHTLVVVLGMMVPLLLLVSWVVTKTRTGKAMRAVAQDQDASRLMGIDVNRIISFTFGLGGALAGAAGLMWEQVIGTTDYNLGFRLGLYAFTAAVLGGIGDLTGAVLGGFIIGILKSINEAVGAGQAWSNTVVFGILIMLMVFRPTGLLGKSLSEKV